MVVALGDEPEAYGIYPGGQSGNPGSPFYSHMVDKWSKGEYFRLNFYKKAPEQAAKNTIYKETYSPAN